MPRIAGVDIPASKRLDIALTYIYGVGRSNVGGILAQAGLDPALRSQDLSADQLGRLQRAVDSMKLEGDLKKEVRQNIARLRQIGAYRGLRHAKGLPVRGQRTRTNARTKRGKRVTIGALKKEAKALVAKEKEAKK